MRPVTLRGKYSERKILSESRTRSLITSYGQVWPVRASGHGARDGSISHRGVLITVSMIRPWIQRHLLFCWVSGIRKCLRVHKQPKRYPSRHPSIPSPSFKPPPHPHTHSHNHHSTSVTSSLQHLKRDCDRNRAHRVIPKNGALFPQTIPATHP